MIFLVNLFILFSLHFDFGSANHSINDGICDGMQLEKYAKRLEKLTDCEIIDGSLTIEWIKGDGENQIGNFSFPKLKEIKGFLKVQQVDSLISLKVLFPNLALIRGSHLHQKFALKIIENKDLEEIGLINLRHIENGNVNIADNARLCFAKTINWTAIAPNSDESQNIIETTREDCENCSNRGKCWNKLDHQTFCWHCDSGVCGPDSICCSPQCLGGCSNDPDDCTACRNFRYEGRCVKKCPRDTLMYKSRFCVSPNDCAKENARPREHSSREYYPMFTNHTRFIQHNGECKNRCPRGLDLLRLDGSFLNFTCIDLRKFKVCENIVINDATIHSLSSFKGCQIVRGFVDITLTIDICDDEDLLSNLSETLQGIVEIHKYLKVSQTPVTDLGFLTNLQRIRGIELETEMFSLVSNSNRNLKRIWLPSQNVSIDRGSIKLEDNPSFCGVDDCDNQTIQVEVRANSYAARIAWNSDVDLPNLKINLWRQNEYLKKSFCQSDDAEAVENSSLGIHYIYSLEPNVKYVYQLISDESLSAPQHFQTPKETIEGVTHTSTSSSITIQWRSPLETDRKILRYELRAFHNPPDKSFYSTKNFCSVSAFGSKKLQILQRVRSSGKFDIAIYKWMRENIVELFLKELRGEEIKQSTIGRDYIYQSVAASVTSFTFDDVEHFSYYYVSIRACYQDANCSEPTVVLTQTTRDYESDRVENLSAKAVDNHAIELTWDSPSRPNGVILTFTVFFQLVGSDHDAKNLCLSYQQFIREGERKRIENLTPGKYNVSVLVRSLAGSGSLSEPILVDLEESYSIYWIISSIAIVLLALVLLLMLQKRRLEMLKDKNPFYTTFVSKPDDGYELERENIEILNELGSGHFGLVFEGILKGFEGSESLLKVAVKTVNNEASFEDSTNFLKEAAVMKCFNTFHIIKLLGIVSKTKPYYVVMELMSNGDLKAFLRKNRPLDRSTIQSDNYTQFPLQHVIPPVTHMAIQIADGMAYLTQKKFVHRDLASRNCMVSSDCTVKIGDFGLTRDVYESDYYRRGTEGVMPVRWMSPESLKDGVFSSESDVFSYGIVLWEIVTYASQPYMGKSNASVLNYIINGGTESRPSTNCSDKVYDIMTKCWRFTPEDRITFMEIIAELLPEAPENFAEHSFYCLRD